MASRLWLAALLALGPALSWAQQVKSVPVEPVGGVNVAVGSPGALPSAGSPSLSPSVSVSLGTPLSLPAAIVPRSFSGGAASRARPTAASELASSAGQTASPASRDVLAAERTALPAERVARMREIEGSLVRAAGEAASEEFGEETIAISRGSTARLTNDEDEPDYDLMVELPASWSAERAAKFFDGSDSDFYHRLQAAGARAAERLFPARAVVATVDFPRALIDPATHRISEGVLLFPLQIRDTATGTLLVDTDVSVTNKKEFANAYPQYFADQMERVRASGGPAAVERMLSDIRLAKKFFREAVGVYKAYKGGPGGVGVEQMVLNAGSFDKMVERLHEAAFDERGQPRSVRSARKAWNVPSPFKAPENFLQLLSDGAWKYVGYSSKAYLAARAEGRTVSMAELHYRKAAPAPERPKPIMTEHETPQTSARELVIEVEMSKSPKVQQQLERIVQRMARRLRTGARPKLQAKAGSKGALWTIRIALRADADSRAQASRATKFLTHEASGLRLLSLSQPSEGKTYVAEPAEEAPAQEAPESALTDSPEPAVQAAPAPASDSVGQATLGLLDKFTVSGPRPIERGDAFLYAQGAKAVPAELEDAWKRRSVKRRTKPGDSVVRTLLTRREGRAYVRIPKTGNSGREMMMQERVPDYMAEGIISGALVNVKMNGDRFEYVEPIGAYPMDMMIGRVVSGPNGPALAGIFFEGQKPVSIYAPLPIVSSKRMNVGRIVQAFVRPAKNGYEAVPLIELGTKITPEIAAREIALRHGARGYFERASIEQAEETARTHDAAAEFAALRERLKGKGKPTYDLRDKEFVTIDPKGAGDLDDAFYIEKHPDGGWTWYLATADVAHFVKPGTPAFRAAARIGNTFYSIDKEGVPEFPMNHPVVSKSAASLLDGKDSLAMITAMRFGPDGKFLLEKSDVAIGIVNVKGRYDYDQVAALWQGAKDTGVRHAEQIALARQLSKFLTRQDVGRGKLDFNLPELRHSKKNGAWVSEDVTDAPITRESHRLIEELKVYGNRVIATRLNMSGAPHISRVHEEQADAVNERLREELKEIGVPWTKGTPAEYLEQVRANKGLTKRQVEVAQILVRNSRRAAKYAAEDSEGHEGLALEAGAYDHPSAPIRRFSDMYNRALLEAYLAGESPADVHAAVLRDLKSLGFADFDEYLEHLNGRAMASRQMDYEVDDFMSVYELAKPENRGKTFTGYVVFRRKGADARVEIKLEGTPATVTLRGREAGQMRLLEEVQVEVLGANLDLRSVDFRVRRKRG